MGEHAITTGALPIARELEHVTIYYEPAEFAGWPFSHGLWAFPDGEILVGFSRGPCTYEMPYDVQHTVVDGMDGEYVTLRSLDSGATWPRASLQVLASHRSVERALRAGLAPSSPASPLDWCSPDFCVTAGLAMPLRAAPHLGYVQYSRDRGHTWEGPYTLPSFGFTWVMAKPNYLVRSDGVVLLFATVARGPNDGRAGSRFVAVYASPDAGLTWNYLSSLQSTAPDAFFTNRYYASPVLLPGGRIVAALRCQIDGENAWPELYGSDDGGRTWRFVSRIADWGGPTHLIRLADGRLLAVYGRRVRPYGIRATISQDGGDSWGPEIVLRHDGGSVDLGYPRAVELTDGRVLAAYYFNRQDDAVQCNGGVRHIAATLFTP